MRHSPPPNGIHLLPQIAAQAAPPQPQQGIALNAGPLMNLDQLISLTAASLPGPMPVADRVDMATDIVAHAVAMSMTGEFNRRLQKRLTEILPPAEPLEAPEG